MSGGNGKLAKKQGNEVQREVETFQRALNPIMIWLEQNGNSKVGSERKHR